MYYLIYKITNTVNNKIYIGAHRTNMMNDSYMGSGIYLKLAVEKYGIENFTKEILFVFDNEKEMFEKERVLVNEEFVQRNDTYNLCVGGGNYPNYEYKISEKMINFLREISPIGLEKALIKLKWLYQNDKQWRKEKIENYKKSMKKYYENNDGFFKGKKHTNETKKKIGSSNSKKQKGKRNSQYGTFWVTDGKNNKKVKCNNEIPEGFVKGRYLDKQRKFCSQCGEEYNNETDSKFCSEICKIRNIGGCVIENFDKLNFYYEKYGSINKAFLKCGILNSGAKTKRFKYIKSLMDMKNNI